MSASVPVCELDQELRTRLNKIKRLSTKSGIAIIMKVRRKYILQKSAENVFKEFITHLINNGTPKTLVSSIVLKLFLKFQRQFLQ